MSREPAARSGHGTDTLSGREGSHTSRMARADPGVTVVGAGPAGAVAALTLARFGCRATLIEATHYDGSRIGETLPPACRPPLERLGLWERFAALGSTESFGNRSAWGSSEPSDHSFVASPYGTGWHVDRRRFDTLMAEAAVAAGATLLRGYRVTACHATTPDGWELTLQRDGVHAGRIRTRALIDATGRGAAIARRIGGRRRVLDHLVGVASPLRDDASPGCYTLVEATEDGWWYSAPVPGDRIMVAFMTDADLCRAGRVTSPDVWLAMLARTGHTSRRVKQPEALSSPRVWPAPSHRLERSGFEKRWLAVGDAALGLDPLCGSGIQHALETGVAAGHAMMHWLEHGGDADAARQYERWLDRMFADYCCERGIYYALEKRWPDSPFWKARAGAWF